ncbi:diacylglycerol kinase [Dactylococcopsis salina PCC 8305]|uniref:Diacylglycerol kinase n=2 Tax=Dactylococcopsis salina TaxID=292566 RepID=K9YSC1_DACS8|nr:diacylglycerol kinase [Dactylococcopsis salina PCC 8305]
MTVNAGTSFTQQTSSQKQGDDVMTLVSKPSTDSSNLNQISSTRKLAFKIAPNLFTSFRYAFAGVRYAFSTQRNFRIHTVIGTIAISLGIFLEISNVEMAVIGITIAFVLALELLNTALESVVDLTVKQTYHELAKVAKDCAAGAVLMGALAALFVAGIILFPPLFTLILS